ncbi:MFS transporter [Candidatus Bathyarchaeota archaeon]|nr:MFS transporter [Candidatus Bathyarchaeota archaeon]
MGKIGPNLMRIEHSTGTTRYIQFSPAMIHRMILHHDPTPSGRGGILGQAWEVLVVQSLVSIAVAGLMLNMLGISQVIWPGDDLHALHMGIIVSAKLVVLAITGIVFGFLADKYRRKSILSISLAIMGIARLCNGFVPSGDSTVMLGFFILFHALLGFGQGGIAPSINAWSNDAIEMDERSRFFGLLETTRQLMLIIGMIASAGLIQLGYWRIYYWISGGALLFGSVFTWLALEEPRKGIKHAELKLALNDATVEYGYKLNRETIKSTIFSKTNIIAFIEGVFTWILFSIAVYLVYPYVQSPPHNISATSSSVLMIVFGIPGAIIGSIAFSKLSDTLAKRHVKNRIYLIIASMVILFCVVILLFIVPLPKLTPGEGTDLMSLVRYPIFIVFGVLIFILRAVLGIYNINQSPILQKINLPEAQGTISSWNQFLETLGYGIGPLISGTILEVSSNYILTAISAMMLGIPAMFMWLLANRWIESDINRVDGILRQRAIEMKSESSE